MNRVANHGAGRLALGVALPVILIAWWHVATRGSIGTTPTPGGVVEAARELIADGDLLEAVRISVGRVLAGFGIALVLGSVVGLLMGQIRIVYEALDPLIEVIRPIAPIALVPLAIVWLGTGGATAVSIITYAAFFPVVLNVYAAARDVDVSLVNAARTFGTSRFEIIRQVILPGVLPRLVVGARLAMGLAWASLIAAELAIGTSSIQSAGLGQLMLISYLYDVDPHPIVVGMVTVGAVGLVLDYALREAGRLLTPWTR